MTVNMPRYSTDNRMTPKTFELHFLPDKAGIEFKICLLSQPGTSLSLGSSTSSEIVETFSSSQMTIKRVFSHSALRIYDQLPYELRIIIDTFISKKKLITYFFKKAKGYGKNSYEF